MFATCARITIVLTAVMLLTGCSGSRPPSQSEQFFPTPGRYPGKPAGARVPRVGVQVPTVNVISGTDDPEIATVAAEELFWTLDHAGRFNLIEHKRLAEMLSEQKSQTAHPAALHGVDYIALCRISDLSIHGDDPPEQVSVAHVEHLLHIAKPQPKINTSCTVELTLFDPAAANISAHYSGSFKRTCSPEAMGLTFDKPEAAWGQFHLTDAQARQVIRVILDDAVRKMLPSVDALLTQPVSTVVTQQRTTPTTRKSLAARIHCPECGFEISADDEFCPNCGAKIPKGLTTKPVH